MPSIISKRKRNQPSATSVSFMMLRVSGTGAGSRDNYRRPFKLHWTFLSDEQRIELSKTSDAFNSPAWRTPWTVLGWGVRDWNFGIYTIFGSTDKVKQHNHKLLWNVAVQSQFGRYGLHRTVKCCSPIAIWKIWFISQQRKISMQCTILQCKAIQVHCTLKDCSSEDEVGIVGTQHL